MTFNFKTLSFQQSKSFKNILSPIFFVILILMNFSTQAQIQDNMIDDPGDIAFVTFFGTSTSQGISFVFLDNCPPGTTISFCDDEWTGAAFATATGEGDLRWTNSTGAVIPRGTVINMSSTTGGNSWSSNTSNIGTLAETDAGFSIGTTNDQVFAYTGTTRAAPGIFLAFYGCATGCTTPNTLTGTGLTAGVTARVGSETGNNLFYGGSTVCSGTIVACATMINTPSNWVAGTYPGSIPPNFMGSALPLRWLNVAGNINTQKQATIDWKVQEINVANYHVEKSDDGTHFASIGTINSKGNGEHNYTFTDAHALNNLTYYRIKQIDNDGRMGYSTIVKLLNRNSEFVIVYPNPVKDEFTLNVDNALLNTNANILNAMGKTVLKIEIFQSQTLINIDELPSGIYLLKTTNGATQKIVKQ
jgi:hypothetical protein